MTRLRLPHLRWPFVVLLASIALTAIAAVEAQRTVRSQQRLAERTLHDYASFAAWSFAQRLSDTLMQIEREVVGAVNHGDELHMNRRVPTAQELAFYLPRDPACACRRPRLGPPPETFLALRIGEDHLDSGIEGADVRTPSPNESRWLIDTLTRRARGLGQPDHGFDLVVGDAGGEPEVLAYTLMPTASGDTMLYAAQYSMASLRGILAGVLDGKGLLPATFTAGRHNRDVLAVRVHDRAGHTVFDSAPAIESRLVARVDLPWRAGLLSVDAFIRPELAGDLIIGGLPRSRLPFVLGLLALAAALSIVAVAQLRRDGELTEVRARFVSSVSHELRTPLAQMRLYTETLQLGRMETEEQRRWALSNIARETTRLSHLVEKTLRFSTLATSDATAASPIDATAEVETIVREFAPLAADRRAHIVVQSDAVPPLRVRPDALRHMVLNVLDNAVKYGPEGQTIQVSVRRDNGSVAIAIDDEGPGIDETERDAVWRAFTRGRSAHHTGGSGIGLTIVREVAAAHGGAARVETGSHGGARFVITLPVDAATETAS
ncbi:MAG TPA: HAMP domain-containing sensor histidine kinase [Gemmatimonadaceae bacterium]|nr:HAMP domain-containing sensor histidine kinase [Gemmatimonadaceae bacterium]